MILRVLTARVPDCGDAFVITLVNEGRVGRRSAGGGQSLTDWLAYCSANSMFAVIVVAGAVVVVVVTVVVVVLVVVMDDDSTTWVFRKYTV